MVKIIEQEILDKKYLMEAYTLTVQVLKIWSQTVTEQWTQAFDRLVKILPPNTVNKECIELAVKLGDIS